MKIIVTHTSPDWDAITSVWLIKKYLSGWENAAVEFVAAGLRSERVKGLDMGDIMQKVGKDEIVHVDTGMGPLDHHETSDLTICGASRTWDYIREEITKSGDVLRAEHMKAIDRVIKIVVEIDHFREIFWNNPTADYQEFSLIGVLEGLKLAKPDEDEYYVEFGKVCLDSVVHEFENRIWAEREIDGNGILFQTRWGKAIGFKTINDSVLKLSQKMGYNLVIRKDPRKSYVRIKLRPAENPEKDNLDLTLAYEKLKKIDPDASWYLHVSKKMLLNGTPKNPKMVPTKLSLEELIKVLEKI